MLIARTLAVLVTTAALAGPCAAPGPPPPAAPPAPPACRPSAAASLVRAEAEWIARAATRSGALRAHPTGPRIDPYLAAYGALGLARASTATCEVRYRDVALDFLDWYAAAMGPAGHVEDHVLVHGEPRPTGEADSTDAYAGMFLVAVRSVQAAGAPRARLDRLAPAVARAVSAIGATTEADGLSRATPEWPVAYLMDQAEVGAGLEAAAAFARARGDARGAERPTTASARLRRGTETLWNPAAGAYDWALHEDGVAIRTNWGQAYPDVLSQAWALSWGLASGPPQTSLPARVRRALPGWTDPRSIALVDGRRTALGWWPVVGWSEAHADAAAGRRLAAGFQRHADATGRAWPYNVGVAGQVIVLATGGWPPASATSRTAA